LEKSLFFLQRLNLRETNVRVRRMMWRMIIFLVVIGVAVVVRRTVYLVPILINGYNPPAPLSNPTVAQFVALDDVFARYPVLTLVHSLMNFSALPFGLALCCTSSQRKSGFTGLGRQRLFQLASVRLLRRPEENRSEMKTSKQKFYSSPWHATKNS
jgi:hypothetical protein